MRQFIEYFRHFQPNVRWYLLQSALVGIAAGAFILLYPLYLSELGYRIELIGLVLFFNPLGAGVAMIPAGWCVDRISHKAILIWSSAVLALAVLGQILFRDLVLLCISAFVLGIGLSFQYVLNAPFLTKNSTPDERAHLFSLNIVLILATAVLGQLLGGTLPPVLAQWLQLRETPFSMFSYLSWLLAAAPLARSYQIVLLSSVIIALISFIPLFLMTADRPTNTRSEQQSSRFLHEIWRRPRKNVKENQDATDSGITLSFWSRLRRFPLSPLGIMTGSYALTGIGNGLLLPYVGLFFVEHLGANSALFGLVRGSSDAVLAFGTLLAPLMVMRIGRLNTIVVTSLLALPVLLSAGIFPLLLLAALLYPLFLVLWNMPNGILQLFGMEVVPAKLQGRANSSYLIAAQVASTAATPIGGLLISRLGYTSVFLITTGLYFLSTVLIWWRFAGKRFRAPQACVEPTEDGQKEDGEEVTWGDVIVASEDEGRVASEDEGRVASEGDVINTK
jgi:MFS family permease